METHWLWRTAGTGLVVWGMGEATEVAARAARRKAESWLVMGDIVTVVVDCGIDMVIEWKNAW